MAAFSKISFHIQLLLGLLALSIHSIAQTNDSDFVEDLRPKFLQFQYRTVTDFTLNSVSQQFGTSVADVAANERFRIKLDAPILLKSKDQLSIGLRLYREEFEFADIRQTDYALYQNIEEKSLWTFGLRTTYRRKMENGKYFLMRIGADLNGDGIDFNQWGSYLKGDAFFLLGKKKDERTEIAYGLGFSYDLGAPLAYPIFRYKKNFGRNWQVNLNLPKEVKLQYAFSPKMYASSKIDISGASYHLGNPVLPGYTNLELRYSELRASLQIDREIYDWLWINGEFGILQNISFYVAEPNQRKNNSLVDMEPFNSTYLNFSLYLVPPRKWYEKNK